MTINSIAEKAVQNAAQGKAMSVFGGKAVGASDPDEKPLGALLIDAGKLKPEHAELILREQRERELRFGETAVKLGLVTQADIEAALSRQFSYPYLRQDNQKLSLELVAAYQPFSRQVETLRSLRSQLMLRWFDVQAKGKALAVVSPERGEGRSFIAANLAVVFSQLGGHTLLIDADMRNPRQHSLFKLDNSNGLSAVLSGRGSPDSVQRIAVLADLSVLPAGSLPPNPQELLTRPLVSHLLAELAAEFDVIVIDTPAGKEYADVQTIAARAGGALMVVHTDVTRIKPTRELAQNISETGATVIGSVMNSF
jgi:chain length determinant protein tyrosine kinase EpsG